MLRRSPVKRIYLTRKESQEKQEATLEELKSKNVRWAMIDNGMLDNREDLRFRNSHSHLWEYFQQEFEEIEVEGGLRSYTLLQRREDRPKAQRQEDKTKAKGRQRKPKAVIRAP